MSAAEIPNAGIVCIEKDIVIKHIKMVINMLFIDWQYLPPANILVKTIKIVDRFYPREDANLFRHAVAHNLKRFNVAIPLLELQ